MIRSRDTFLDQFGNANSNPGSLLVRLGATLPQIHRSTAVYHFDNNQGQNSRGQMHLTLAEAYTVGVFSSFILSILFHNRNQLSKTITDVREICCY